MASITDRLARIKRDPGGLFRAGVVEAACRAAGHCWRTRTLGPAETMTAFATQILHGNTAIAHVVGLMDHRFTESAYCQARARLPVQAVRAAFEDFTAQARGDRRGEDGLWCGHRVMLADGSGINTPDTPALRSAFGVASACAEGGGLPTMQVLVGVDAHTGLLLDLHAAPVHTHDLAQVGRLHPALRAGDVLVGDRAFCAYSHLHQLQIRGCHGVFRVGTARPIPFPARTGQRPRRAYNRHRAQVPILVELISEDDQCIEILKPRNCPLSVSVEAFAQMPRAMIVRAVRYRVRAVGTRTHPITLLTTLTDPQRYSAQTLGELYLMRWRVETDLRHLKRTMGMDRLKCATVEGVQRELLMFALVYNAVCVVRTRAARRQGVESTRVSFIDALRALRQHAALNLPDPPTLKVWPQRPGRVHPRLLKREHSHFPVMHYPRAAVIRRLLGDSSHAN